MVRVRSMDDYAFGKAWKIAKKQHILETAFALFSERGIESVTVPEIAEACGVGRATVYRYFATKMDLVVAVGTWKWETYIRAHDASLPAEILERMTGAEYLRFYLDAFLDLYRNHRDILRFNYGFNSYLQHGAGSSEQKRPYMAVAGHLAVRFHELYERGRADGTLNTQISEEEMFSSSFHIMLAAVTRYAVGLVYIPEHCVDPESELVMLEELLFSHYIKQ